MLAIMTKLAELVLTVFKISIALVRWYILARMRIEVIWHDAAHRLGYLVFRGPGGEQRIVSAAPFGHVDVPRRWRKHPIAVFLHRDDREDLLCTMTVSSRLVTAITITTGNGSAAVC